MDLRVDSSPYDFPFLRCPSCSGENVHVQHAFVAGPAPAETTMRVDALPVRAQPVAKPRWMSVGDGGNVAVAVAGYCEACPGAFAVVFEQDQGITRVKVEACPEIVNPMDLD